MQNHPTCILIQKLNPKSPPVHNPKIYTLVPFLLLLELHSPIPTTGLLIGIYHEPLSEGTVSRSKLRSIHQAQVNLLQINPIHPVIINFVEKWQVFNIQTAIGVFRYAHINPDLLTLTILTKLLCDHPFNPLGFLPYTVLRKLVFQHEDDLAQIIVQSACIEIESAVTLKVFTKKLSNGCGAQTVTAIS